MSPAPRFVLVRPRTPANVGSVARVMKNFGFFDLFLVDPRLHRHTDEPGHPSRFEAEARKTAWNATDVFEQSKRGTLEEAVGRCVLVLATAPQSFRNFPVWAPEKAAMELMNPANQPSAVVFGSESSGLDAGELARCRGVIVIPTHEGYRDLNLAQSAALMAYLCFKAGNASDLDGAAPAAAMEPPAPTDLVSGLSDRLVSISDRIGFTTAPNAPVLAELRNILHRHGLTRREAALMRAFFGRVDASLKALGTQGKGSSER